MASSHKSEKCLINILEIRNDLNIIFNKLITNIDKHENKTINKELLKEWINDSKQEFSDQIKKRKFISKSLNEDLFTTNLSPIHNHFNDSQHNVSIDFDQTDDDLNVSEVFTNGQLINESLNDEMSEETIAVKSHINDNQIIDNIINNRDIEVESDSIEIVENIDNNMDYMDFITSDNQINEDIDEDIDEDNDEDNDEVSNEHFYDNNSEVDNQIEDQFSEKEINDHNYSVDNNEDNCDQKSDCNDNSVDENEKYSQIEQNYELINNENSVDINEIEVEVSQMSDHEMVDTNAGNNNEVDSDEEEEQRKTNLRPRKNGSNSDKSCSLSSDVEFDDLSDSPQSDSSSDDDEDYKNSSQRVSKYERVANDRKLKMKASVNLINLDNDLIEESLDDASNVCQNIEEVEKQMFDSLRSKGFIFRKIIAKTKTRSKEDEDSDEKEFKQMLRIPKISNIAKKRKKRNSDIKNNDQNNSNDSEKSDCEKRSKNKRKKLKSSNTGESDNDLDSDDITSTVLKRRDESPPKLSNNSKTVDILDSDVSSAEEDNNKDDNKDNNKDNDNEEKLKKKKLKKSDNENSDKDNDCDHKNKNNIDKVLKKTNALLKDQKKESKSVIDIESDSEEEVVSKKRIIKRRVSDDSYCEKISDNEDSDSSIIESSGMDPSGPDSDSDSNLDSDSNNKSKNKKTSKRKVKTKSKGKRKRVVSLYS